MTDGLAKVAAKALHMSEPTLEELKDDKLKKDCTPLVCSISKQSYSLHLAALESKNCTRLGPAWHTSHSPNPNTNSISATEKLESHHLDMQKSSQWVSPDLMISEMLPIQYESLMDLLPTQIS